ncbi:MAG: cyclase family protein, partial [Actinomycetes bacterium]
MPLPGELAELAAKVSNWGRWGDDDELGTANLIDAAATQRGVAAVRSGQPVSLAVDLRADGVQVGQPARRYNPILAVTSLNERDPFAPGIWEGTDEIVMMSTCAGTHIDALCHVSYDGFFYNGVATSATTAQAGASKMGAETLRPIVTRGVLLDLPLVKGVSGLDEVDPGYAVTGDDLDAAAAAAGVTITPGDVVLVRTGEMRHYRAGDRKRYAMGSEWKLPGLSVASVQWVRDHDVAGVFTDTYAYECMPPSMPDWSDCLAVHLLHIRDMGLLQGQNWDLEALAVACAAAKQWEFLLTAVPE